jgi:hypothetical protein
MEFSLGWAAFICGFKIYLVLGLGGILARGIDLVIKAS